MKNLTERKERWVFELIEEWLENLLQTDGCHYGPLQHDHRAMVCG